MAKVKVWGRRSGIPLLVWWVVYLAVAIAVRPVQLRLSGAEGTVSWCAVVIGAGTLATVVSRRTRRRLAADRQALDVPGPRSG